MRLKDGMKNDCAVLLSKMPEKFREHLSTREAWVRGYVDGLDGRSESSCPHSKTSGMERLMNKAWLDGHAAGRG